MTRQPQIITAEEAAKLVKSGDMIGITTFGLVIYPEDLVKALENRFLETGEPKSLTLWNTIGGSFGAKMGSERFGHDGFCKKVIMGYWRTAPNLVKMAVEEKFEAYNLPLGVMAHLIHAAAGRKPGIISPIGVKTFVDPRYGGCRMNSISKESWSEVMVIDNQEYLFFRAPKLDVCFIRGTTADPKGNVTMEKESNVLDVRAYAQAVKAYGGTVICQVERLSQLRAHPHMVKIPRFLIDYIVVAPEQRTNRLEAYNPAYTGEVVLSKQQVREHNEMLIDKSKGIHPERKLEDWVIARRAAQELESGAVINLGVGMPDLVATIAQKEDVIEDLIFTVETGPVGGVPAASAGFGASLNPEAIMEQAHLFDSYDGGVLDLAFVGAAEFDPDGSVNIGRFGSLIAGVGGFPHITQNSRKVIFMTTFRGGNETDMVYTDGALQIRKEGHAFKFKKSLEQINYSGAYAREMQKEVIYITERCVFEQRPAGLTVTEIAPGIDIERDIFNQMEFRPLVADTVKVMDQRLFTGEALGLKEKFDL